MLQFLIRRARTHRVFDWNDIMRMVTEECTDYKIEKEIRQNTLETMFDGQTDDYIRSIWVQLEKDFEVLK